MGEIRAMEKARLSIGVLCKDRDLLADSMDCLTEFGSIEIVSPLITFNYTDYYTSTMGKPLFRRFYVFAEDFAPTDLPDIKIRTNQLEKMAADSLNLGVERPLNLDPGYLTPSKLLLASTKDHAHRIFQRDGIFAEITLYYRNKTFRAWPWTFPDYASETYIQFFNQVKKLVFLKY